MKVVKRNATMENMRIDAPKQVWGCLKVVFSRKMEDEKSECQILGCMCTLGKL